MRRGALWLLVSFCFLLACMAAPANRVLLEADGGRRWLPVGEAQTVGEVLRAAQVALGPQDRVEPSSVTLAEPGLRVRVVRVRERTIQEERLLPFARQVRRDASLPQGESRLVQLGANGREQVTWRLTLEDGTEVRREVASRDTLAAPTTEVLVIGTRGTGLPVPFRGTIVYLEQGNAWVMRGDSAQKRALTRAGDLDGHVFALSPDGRWLLFTRRPLGGASGQAGPLNTLWLVDTRIANEEPRSLELSSVLWAGWEPCPNPTGGDCPLQIAFSTAERVPTPPGWRAANDLQRFGLNADGVRGEGVPLLAASNPVLGWWGRQWRWSPDGARIAWGDATRIGVVEVATGAERVLAQFTPFETRAAWVWTPQLAWAADGRSVMATVHRAAEEADPERGERFDLWRLFPSGSPAEPIVETVGPFAMPQWLDRGRLVYGQAEDRESAVASRYRLMVREGSDAPRLLFPAPDQPGLDVPWSAWNRLDDALLTVWQGDLYLVSLNTAARPRPLTAEGGASHPQWAP